MLIKYNISNIYTYPFDTAYNASAEALNNIIYYLEDSKY